MTASGINKPQVKHVAGHYGHGGRSTGGYSKTVLFPLPCNKPFELGRCVRTHWCKDTSQHGWLKGQAKTEDIETDKNLTTFGHKLAIAQNPNTTQSTTHMC